MSEKTKAEIKKELLARQRDVEYLNGRLEKCHATNNELEAKIKRANSGWSIRLHEQTLRGEYSSVKEKAKMLIEQGFWFFDLVKE